MENLEETFSDLASFSLAQQPDNFIINTKNSDNSFYIYMGIALLVIVVSFFIYKYYSNQKKVRFLEENNETSECSYNVCSIN